MNYLIRFGQSYAVSAVVFLGLFPIYLARALPSANSAGIPDRFSLYSYAIICVCCAWTILARKQFAKKVISFWAILSIVLSPWKGFFHLSRFYFYLPVILVVGLILWFYSPIFKRLVEPPLTGETSS